MRGCSWFVAMVGLAAACSAEEGHRSPTPGDTGEAPGIQTFSVPECEDQGGAVGYPGLGVAEEIWDGVAVDAGWAFLAPPRNDELVLVDHSGAEFARVEVPPLPGRTWQPTLIETHGGIDVLHASPFDEPRTQVRRSSIVGNYEEVEASLAIDFPGTDAPLDVRALEAPFGRVIVASREPVEEEDHHGNVWLALTDVGQGPATFVETSLVTWELSAHQPPHNGSGIAFGAPNELAFLADETFAVSYGPSGDRADKVNHVVPAPDGWLVARRLPSLYNDGVRQVDFAVASSDFSRMGEWHTLATFVGESLTTDLDPIWVSADEEAVALVWIDDLEFNTTLRAVTVALDGSAVSCMRVITCEASLLRGVDYRNGMLSAVAWEWDKGISIWSGEMPAPSYPVD